MTSSTSRILVGVVLIVAPLLAVVLKSFSFGWMIVFLLFGPIFLLIAGYALQIVIAIHSFMSKKHLHGTHLRRASIAAWVTSVGIVVLGIFMPDGGDMYWGSTFQAWLGAYGPNADAVHAATDGWSDWVAVVAVAVWLVGYVWLLVEWVVALVQRSRAKRAGGVLPA
ncbi:MAG: hypothetical protein WDA07_12660 [Leucobacter sp.]